MKIEQLKYFVEAARQEHIGKAASIVAITPSAVSHSIAALERELGRELFVKKGKNIFITNYGKLLMEKADRFLREIDVIKDEIASDNVELQGHYRLAGSHGLCSRYLATAWSSIQKAHSKLTVEMYTLRSADVINGVADGEFDLGLCFSPQPHPRVEAKPLFHGQIWITVRKGHPILKTPELRRISVISKYPAALPRAFQGVDNCESHPVFKKFGIEPKVTFLSDSQDLALAKILSSDAWGFFPSVVVKTNPDLVPIIPENWKADYTIAAIWPKHRMLTRVLKMTIDKLEQKLRRWKSS